MSLSTPDACERLPWDSAFFGVAIARMTRTRPTAPDLAAAVAWARDAAIDCLYLLADADDQASVRAAEEHRFSLVGVRVTLERAAPADATRAEVDAGVRPATAADLPRLASIARVSHRNTRFHRDARFAPSRADEMYAVWIERAVNGELAHAVWVVDTGDGPVGYLAVSRQGMCASIGLVAVDAACRGLGYGERLVRTALAWAAEQKAARISVVTHGHEPAAVRFYERSGFSTRQVQLWYHYWARRTSSAGSQ